MRTTCALIIGICIGGLSTRVLMEDAPLYMVMIGLFVFVSIGALALIALDKK